MLTCITKINADLSSKSTPKSWEISRDVCICKTFDHTTKNCGREVQNFGSHGVETQATQDAT